jgi:hypothetical protein
LRAEVIFSQRRLDAYRVVYEAGVAATTQLELLSSETSEQSVQDRRECIAKFVKIWQSNRLFLTDHAGDKVTQFLANLHKRELAPGGVAPIKEFQRNVEDLLVRLRRDMNEDIESERNTILKRSV